MLPVPVSRAWLVRRQRGSVLVEFWFFFIMWLALTMTSIQVILTTNRQICVNYYAFLAARAHMAQPTDSKGDDWVGYVRTFYRNFGIENRYLNYWTTFEHKDNQISSRLANSGPGVLVTDRYPQRWAGLIRMAYPFAGAGNYPYTITVNSWAFTPRCSQDEEESDDTDNDVDDYGGYQALAATIGTLMGYWNTISGMF